MADDTAAVAAGLRAAFALNTRLFLNTLADVSDADAGRRIDGHTNSMAFIGAHLVDARHFTARSVGVATTNPLEATLRDVRGIEDAPALPGGAALREYWRSISAVLEERAGRLGADELSAPSAQSFPIGDPTLLGALNFLLHHEAYHIGQLALLRKHLGYPAMGYGPAAPEPGANAPPAGVRDDR